MTSEPGDVSRPGIPGDPDVGPVPLHTAFSDIDLRRWREYPDIITDSLWLFPSRDRSGPHLGDYWGNFVPQIPNQIIRRFSKRGEVILDLFAGMGTTLIECCHLGRHGIGVELVPAVAADAARRISQAANTFGVSAEVLVGDSRLESTAALVRHSLAALQRTHADCLILHPPYHDIIRFGDDAGNLSNQPTVEDFLREFARVVDQGADLLAPGRFLALVVGDTYGDGEWVPLSFLCMEVCRQRGLVLKGINIKDIQGNEKGKGRSGPLWRYRALSQGFYVFKHEYIFVFRKGSSKQRRLRNPAAPRPVAERDNR
jgi:DNA modification methylase